MGRGGGERLSDKRGRVPKEGEGGERRLQKFSSTSLGEEKGKSGSSSKGKKKTRGGGKKKKKRRSYYLPINDREEG